MTDQSEVEKIANFIDKNFGVVCPKDLATWHIREKEIAVLEAVIRELNDYDEYGERISRYQSRLAELRKEKV